MTRKKTHRRTRSAVALALAAAVLGQCAAHAGSGKTDIAMFRTPLYTAEGDAIVRHNGPWFNNRPLYCNQSTGIVVTGDRPLVRFGADAALNGTFIAALVRGNTAKWLHDFSDVTSKYRTDRMEWQLKDEAFGDTALTLEAVPPANGVGMVIHLRVENAQPGDRLIWACGGASNRPSGMQTAYDMATGAWSTAAIESKQVLKQSFFPEDCQGNHVTVSGGVFTTQFDTLRGSQTMMGQCSAPSQITIADADAWADPLKLTASSGSAKPVACAVVGLDGQSDIYWAMSAETGDTANDPASPAEAFAAGMKRATEIENRVVVDTPDARLNAEVAASGAVIDGVFRSGIFTHSGMRWGVPLLGWRTMYGGTVYGWHDRVKTQASLALPHQITKSDFKAPKPDVRYGLTSQALDAKMFGVGRVDFHQPSHYDMQTQFFDQLVHAWRWTGDPQLEKMLRPALELHLDYIRDNFDPNHTGLYESYANTWPTDDQWYNGGGTAEETAYAYNGEKAALEMAQRAGDKAGVKKHAARVALIEKSLLTKLWVPGKDYVGGWVEQGGHERLHEDGWLYATFCPIDAGMLNTNQAAQTLYYSEWALERENMPYGGQRCWTSNWVPSKWSLREMWPGDSYGLALAYFQTGLAEDGWTLLRGTFPAMAFYGPTPGDLGHPNGGTDFNDCASMFCRTVVEGLFGYRPNYPDGVVTIAPQLPASWDHASIKTPDFSLAVASDTYHITLTQPAALDLRLPVRARRLAAVTVNGMPAKWVLLPGFGCSIAQIAVPKTGAADVQLTVEEPLPQSPAVSLEANAGEPVDLSATDAQVVHAPTVPATEGYHLVDELVKVGDAPQIRVFKIKVSDPKADAARAAHTFDQSPAGAHWESVDASHQFNGDVRTIFQQQYLSPRPQTSSLRLATDGYSTWQEMLGPGVQPSKAPPIDLTDVPALQDPATHLLATPQGVPFAWGGDARNIAFTSMWDNWPRQVTVPVGRKADAISLLLCGFTNPMQVRIANAEVRLTYSDGVVDRIELVPPFNFWSLCPFGGSDYDYARDGFALPPVPPPTVQLGNNCRANLLNVRLRPDATLKGVTLETMSQEVIIGLMGASVMNPH